MGIRDLKRTFRSLLRTPGMSLIAVLTLAFAVGASTTLFSIVDGVLIRPLPFPASANLVTLGDQVSGTAWGLHDPGYVSGPEVITYSREMAPLATFGGYRSTTFELVGSSRPAQIKAARITYGIFSALEVRPFLGRVFTTQDDVNSAQVAVLSYRTWIDRFGGNPHILGANILLDRKPYVVIGVMPKDFEFPLVTQRVNRTELWIPMSFTPPDISVEAMGNWTYRMIGRLKPGVTIAQAQADADRVAQQIMKQYPVDLAGYHIRPVIYTWQKIAVSTVRPLLEMFLLAVLVVLLIASTNLAALLLLRALDKQHDFALRLCMGASFKSLIKQPVVEGVMLSVSGGAVGVGLAELAVRSSASFFPDVFPRADEIVINWVVLGFGFLLSVLTGVCAGMVPAFAIARTDLSSVLKMAHSHLSTKRYMFLRSALVVSEIGIALTLLTASGLLLRSFDYMLTTDLGFHPDHVLTAGYSLPGTEYSTQDRVDSFNRVLLQEIARFPGVSAAALTSELPVSGTNGVWPIVVERYSRLGHTSATPCLIMGNYFRAMGISLWQGRFFTQSDNANSQLVVIVNRKFASYYWPDQSPLGKRIRIGTQADGTPWMTVIGEVSDAKMMAPDSEVTPEFYIPVEQARTDEGQLASPADLIANGGYIAVRSALPPDAIENAVRSTVHYLDPLLPLTHIETMDEVVFESESLRRFNTLLIGTFALCAILLAGMGIYSVIAFAANSRRREIAIRMALGSSRSAAMILILRSGLTLGLIGCVFGVAGAVATSRIVGNFLFHVDALDPVVLAFSSAMIMFIALGASAMPARRVAMHDPIQALRDE